MFHIPFGIDLWSLGLLTELLRTVVRVWFLASASITDLSSQRGGTYADNAEAATVARNFASDPTYFKVLPGTS